MKIPERILFFLILLVLAAPAMQKYYGICNEKELKGCFEYAAPPEPEKISRESWFSGQYQNDLQIKTENYTGFRSYFFVLHNQYDYSLFGRTHALGIIAGKDGMLYEEDYIREYNGDFFIGSSTLDLKINRLKEVSDSLESHGTKLLIVLEPGKATFFPEYIPDFYHIEKKKITNYDYITDKFREKQIPFLDLNNYFLMMKDTSSYPLFPKYGMHWSHYGMSCIIDTFSRYFESRTGKKLPSFRIGKVTVTDSSRYSDNDIGALLNLIWPVYKQNVAYPEMIFGNEKRDSLKVLVIGDSYYAGLEEFAVPHLFGKDTYWYYNSKVFPHTIETDNPVWVDKSRLDTTLVKYDVILLMCSELNLHCFFWGFPDEAWAAFHPGYKETADYLMENRIRNERGWIRSMVQKAWNAGKTLEEVIKEDAAFMVKQ